MVVKKKKKRRRRRRRMNVFRLHFLCFAQFL